MTLAPHGTLGACGGVITHGGCEVTPIGSRGFSGQQRAAERFAIVKTKRPNARDSYLHFIFYQLGNPLKIIHSKYRFSTFTEKMSKKIFFKF
jgi:hypothetical protein